MKLMIRPGDLAYLLNDLRPHRVLEVGKHQAYLLPIYEPHEKQAPTAKWVKGEQIQRVEACR